MARKAKKMPEKAAANSVNDLEKQLSLAQQKLDKARLGEKAKLDKTVKKASTDANRAKAKVAASKKRLQAASQKAKKLKPRKALLEASNSPQLKKHLMTF
jgi:hypothetical protein